MSLEALPDVVYASIFSFLRFHDLLRASQASRWFRDKQRMVMESISMGRLREQVEQRSLGALTKLLLSLTNLKNLEARTVTTGLLEAIAEAFGSGGGRSIQRLGLKDFSLRLSQGDVRLVTSILAAKSLPALRSLSLYLNDTHDLGPVVSVLLSRHLDKLELLPSLAALYALAQALRPPYPPSLGGLKELELSIGDSGGEPNTQEQLSVVLQSPLCARLEKLDVYGDGCRLYVTEVDAIGEYLRDRGRTSLRTLYIGAWEGAITTAFVETVAAGALQLLESFSLDQEGRNPNDIPNIMSAIVSAGGCPGLRELSIWGDDLFGVCAVPVAQALGAGAFPALEKLELQHWRHRDTDIAALGRALRQPGVGDHLTNLDLSFDLEWVEDDDERYGDIGMVALVSALEAGAMPQLRKLSLRGVSASEEGITRLAKALKNQAGRHLRELDLTGNMEAGEDGVMAMREALEAGACPSLEMLEMGQYRSLLGRFRAKGFMDSLRRSGAACVGTLERFRA